MVVSVSWSQSTKESAKPDGFQAVDVEITSPKICADWLDQPELAEKNIVCASFSNTTINVCQGDDGSPLYTNNGGNHYIIGVASWGEKCAQKNSPRVYAKVSAYLDWIQSHAQEN
ncbi:unnamed protein product [Allacma fusca]|uniref:Peptidase S1 domain-containing protein n=1 Tax=Allacma fusca TaxID=39272 RepID=A0A8J2PVY8_9HEXA|nr:unnamed protein product [Allacma fusca]